MTEPGGEPGTEPGGAVPPQHAELLNAFKLFWEHHCSQGARPGDDASSSNIGNVPERDKKTPKRKKNEPNKKLQALKKKVADEKAKHLKAVKELKYQQTLATIERKEKLLQKRKSLAQKDEEELQKLKESINRTTAQ